MEITTINLIITSIIAGIVALIGFLQYRTSKRQQEVAEEEFKLDLFNKRFKVFEATRTLFFHAMQSAGEIDKQELPEFCIKTIEAVFLFDEGTSKYLEEAEKKVRRLIIVSKKCKNLHVGAELDKLVKEQTEIGDWFSSEFFKLQNLFSPYLKFRVWKEN